MQKQFTTQHLNPMFNIEVHLDVHSQKWFAFLVDSKGQLGEGQYAETKELAIFRLGVQYAKNPAAFARLLSEILLPNE